MVIPSARTAPPGENLPVEEKAAARGTTVSRAVRGPVSDPGRGAATCVKTALAMLTPRDHDRARGFSDITESLEASPGGREDPSRRGRAPPRLRRRSRREPGRARSPLVLAPFPRPTGAGRSGGDRRQLRAGLAGTAREGTERVRPDHLTPTGRRLVREGATGSSYRDPARDPGSKKPSFPVTASTRMLKTRTSGSRLGISSDIPCVRNTPVTGPATARALRCRVPAPAGSGVRWRPQIPAGRRSLG